VGSFYGRFQGKEELLDFIDARGEKELSARWDEYFSPERWQGVPASEVAARFIHFWVAAHRARKGVTRALHLRLRSRPTRESLGRSRRLNRKVIGGMLALLRERRSEIAHPDLDRALPFALVMVAASIREWILFEDLNLYPRASDDQTLAEELTRAFTAYLGVRRPRPERKAPPAAASLRAEASAHRSKKRVPERESPPSAASLEPSAVAQRGARSDRPRGWGPRGSNERAEDSRPSGALSSKRRGWGPAALMEERGRH
jgi:hypothetical protein